MKVLGVVAGPRRGGNTARLVEGVLAGAAESGHETHIYYMSDMDVSPLMHDGEEYVYPEDDFASLMPHIESMGALVLGSPVYYDHVSTRCKLFIDRLYYYGKSHGDEYRALFPGGVKFVPVLSCGWDNPDVYGEVQEWMNKRMTHYWDMKVAGSLKAYGTGSHPVQTDTVLLA